MAAYGKVRGVAKPIGSLPARLYPIQDASETQAAILTVAIDFAAGDTIDEQLATNLHHDFNLEIQAGRTYPQEDALSTGEYATYFQSYDLIVGFHITRAQLRSLYPATSSTATTTTSIPENGTPLPPISFSNVTRKVPLGPETPAIDLPPTYAFAYYIKPNYPGRSSHLCNAGFIVPASLRGQGLGRIAAQSFCYYGPACGYRGSIFNLVYVNNEASVKLWERLGFRNVGRIPEAGRLKKVKGGGGAEEEEEEEEYVDAWVVYGDFKVVGVRDAE